MSDYYKQDIQTVLKELNSSKSGLSSVKSKVLLEKNGPNVIKTEKGDSWVVKLLRQFKEILVIILIIASVISFLLGEKSDAIIIFGIVILNAIIGFVQEYKAENAINALKKMIAPKAKVLRDNKQMEIPAEDVVEGDILILDEGAKIVADARIIESFDLRCEQSVLTGESVPVSKNENIIKKVATIVDQTNMVFSGTSVARGKALAIVTGTGSNTEFGKIAQATSSISKGLSPLQKELNDLAKLIAKITLVVCAVVLIAGLLKGENPVKMFLFSVSLAVAAVPEGLPATITIALALGVQRLAKQRSIVRKLSSVETLGCTNIICSDKTGTLTKNEMTVRKIFSDVMYDVTGTGYDTRGTIVSKEKKKINVKDFAELGNAIVLCNDSEISQRDGKNIIVGDPTEGALVVLGEKLGLKKSTLLKKNPVIYDVPFNSENRYMVTVHKISGNKYVAYMKGSPDVVLKKSRSYLGKKLTKSLIDKLDQTNTDMAKDALRVLAVASKTFTIKTKAEFKKVANFKDFNILGFVGMIDPPRAEVKDAVKLCKQAGIRINIVTGDNGITAKAIAKELGIANDKTRVILGTELDTLSDKQLKKILHEPLIFARVAPEHKLRVVNALENEGYVVAVTGDGVNDAPALKKASIGVAMGSGTDVSKEASTMVLADDSFATIVSAIKEGRTIYDNIKKFVTYLFSSNIGEVLVVFISMLLGLPFPLLAIQILAINLGTDVLPSLALAMEKPEKDIMERRPRSRKSKIVSKHLMIRLIARGLLIAVASLSLFYTGLLDGGWTLGEHIEEGTPAYARGTTLVFVSLIVFQMVNVFNCKSEKKSLFLTGILNNMYLIGAVLSSLALCCFLVYLPSMQELFHTLPISTSEWFAIGWRAGALFVFDEIWKFFLRRVHKN